MAAQQDEERSSLRQRAQAAFEMEAEGRQGQERDLCADLARRLVRRLRVFGLQAREEDVRWVRGGGPHTWPAVTLSCEDIDFGLDTFAGGSLWVSVPCPVCGRRKPATGRILGLADLGAHLASPCTARGARR
ncbi:MAG TPA: hypothetical protein VMU90_00510 [Solirubrobacteraceae bacterium]|nr:hypothetical protein [Solirubrobacteraceae bacterium]